MDFIEPCFGIGHNLSLICQMTSEDIKHQLIFSFLIGWVFMAQLSKVLKVVCWAGSVPFPPVSLQRQVVCLTVAAGVHVFSSGESLHCFQVGWCTNKSYVIATSDLWLFIHASNLLSLNSPSPLPYKWIGPKAVGRPKSQGYWQWPENGNHGPGLHQSPGRTSGLNSWYLG